ncbi:MAG: hypothetical protein COV29_01130 [Candidatus Yanofskybacteria bacterium CG10_big_fil_rev_8_21_14_0_10_36_16]|uniref:Uncharacterized protein n=1 Tax=Candidatus Yanofskybacteria bacterium CG10_big_fil_rev_8_21_14_0_10_36_16 TaxID=1975096 RepID=A0A2J0QAZ2_9BACT|nr:MAG: hypothetical protein COV29_01130 [Candidatus Yanofskybacteria bacterium CG10_big_fil_rev_8_21_14_0_10_36_16]
MSFELPTIEKEQELNETSEGGQEKPLDLSEEEKREIEADVARMLKELEAEKEQAFKKIDDEFGDNSAFLDKLESAKTEEDLDKVAKEEGVSEESELDKEQELPKGMVEQEFKMEDESVEKEPSEDGKQRKGKAARALRKLTATAIMAAGLMNVGAPKAEAGWKDVFKTTGRVIQESNRMEENSQRTEGSIYSRRASGIQRDTMERDRIARSAYNAGRYAIRAERERLSHMKEAADMLYSNEVRKILITNGIMPDSRIMTRPVSPNRWEDEINKILNEELKRIDNFKISEDIKQSEKSTVMARFGKIKGEIESSDFRKIYFEGMLGINNEEANLVVDEGMLENEYNLTRGAIQGGRIEASEERRRAEEARTRADILKERRQIVERTADSFRRIFGGKK